MTSEGCGGDTSTSHPNHTYGWGRIDAWSAYTQHILELDNRVSTTVATPGDILTYTFTITHLATITPTNNVTLVSEIPTGTDFISATLPFTLAPDSVDWNFGSLTPFEKRQVELVVQIPFDTPLETIVNNQYSTYSDNVTPPVNGEPVSTLVHHPGVELSPNQSGIIFDPCNDSSFLIFSHPITNTGNFTDTFALSLDSSQGWAQLGVDQITLAPAEAALFDVEITPTCPTLPGTIDLTAITAISSADVSVTATITDTTKIGYRLFFPVIVKE